MDVSPKTSKLFIEQFRTDRHCLAYLAKIKWAEGYKCSRCGHRDCTSQNAYFSKVCKKCNHVESATAGTLFRNVRFGLRKAFMIAYEVCDGQDPSEANIMHRYQIHRSTTGSFLHKIRMVMKNNNLQPSSDGEPVFYSLIEGMVHHEPIQYRTVL